MDPLGDWGTGDLGDRKTFRTGEGGGASMGVLGVSSLLKRSVGRSIASTGRQRSWNIASGSFGVLKSFSCGNPPAAILLARMSSATVAQSRWLVMSQCSFLTVAEARYGIIHRAKLSASGISGGKAWAREKVVREVRLDRIRARAGKEVRGVWRRCRRRRGWLAAQVAKEERPVDVMPVMCVRDKV